MAQRTAHEDYGTRIDAVERTLEAALGAVRQARRAPRIDWTHVGTIVRAQELAGDTLEALQVLAKDAEEQAKVDYYSRPRLSDR